MGRFFGTALLLATLAVTPAVPPVTLASLLTAAAGYAASYDAQFSNVVSEERYLQRFAAPGRVGMAGAEPLVGEGPFGNAGAVAAGPVAVTRREMRSDFLLVRTSDLKTWIPFRDVFEVDGKAVRNREARLIRLFLQPAAATSDQVKQIVDESARFNIGNIERTINVPVLALAVLRPVNQSRFRFTLGKEDRQEAGGVWIVSYQEQTTPTIIHGAHDRDIAAHGRFWIEAATGRVVKSELKVNDNGMRAAITTRYRVDAGFGVAVPIDMREEYILESGGRIEGVATYGHFRRFEVNTSEQIKK